MLACDIIIRSETRVKFFDFYKSNLLIMMNMPLTWNEVFVQSLQNLWFGVMDVLPKIVLGVLLFIVGWLIASLVQQGIREIIKAIKLDNLLAHTGIDETLKRAGFSLDSGMFLGALLKWFIVVLFLQLSLGVVGLTQVNDFLSRVVDYVPNVIVAGILLIVGSLIANFVGHIVEGSVKATHLGGSHVAGSVARWAIWIFVILAAVTQLQLFNQIILPLVYGIIVMLALAGGLAFGLGGRDAAAKMIEGWSKKD